MKREAEGKNPLRACFQGRKDGFAQLARLGWLKGELGGAG
jgi:hypothetical protein